MGAEHGVDDLDHGLVLPHAAVAHAAQAPQPGLQPQAVARQAAEAAQHRRFAHQAAEAGAGAVGQAGLERGGLAEQGFEVEFGVRAEQDQVACADRLQGVVGGKGFDHQSAAAAFLLVAQLQRVQAGVAGEAAQGGEHLVDYRQTHRCTLHSPTLLRPSQARSRHAAN